MKKVVAYCRVSTDKFDQLNSFENQKSYFEEELSKENGYELIEIFSDKGLTGTKFKNRKEFNNMMRRAGLDIDENNGKYFYSANKYTTPEFNYIYVTNTSRFARNIECVQIIRALKDKGVYVVFKDLGKSTENPQDETILQIFFTMDEQESRDKSLKVTNGHRRSAIRTDTIHTNSRLYGYKLIRDENRLEVIDEEAEVIKLIYSLYIEGNGQRIIVNKLNDMKIKTRSGKSFGISTINNILKNIKYCGISNRLAYTAPKLFGSNKIKRNSEEDIHYKETDRIPVIIDKEVFDKSKEIREGKVYKGKGVYKGSNIYGNKIKCSCCGSNYTSNIDKGRIFYNCSTKKAKGVKVCSNKNISLVKLEDKIDEFRGSFYIYICTQFAEIKNLLKSKISEYNKIIKNQNVESLIEEINVKINNLMKKNEKILDLYLDDKLTKVLFENKQTEINEALDNLKGQLENLNKGISEDILIRDELVSTYNELEKQIKSSKHIKKEDFLNIIDYISINNDDISIVTTLEVMIKEVKELLGE